MRMYTWDMATPPTVRNCTHFACPVPLASPCIHPSLHQLRPYLIDDPFLNQKHLKTFEYRIHWNINIRKNEFLYEKENGSARCTMK